jgi:putative phosphoesterase
MRVAALYDVHGNLPALEAVLAEVKRERVDAVVVGGDICSGPFPRESLAVLRALGGQARFLRGNADRELVEGGGPGLSDDWCVDELRGEPLDFLAGLPETVELDIPGLGRVLFCHGTPRSDEEIVTRATPDGRLREALAGVAADVVVCGHTHVQYDRVVDGVRLVNAGSVGMPYEDEPGARWALLGPGVRLRSTSLDPEVVAGLVRRSAWPGADEFARRAVLEAPSAAEATDFFERLARERGA